jgi:hypothetical protein
MASVLRRLGVLAVLAVFTAGCAGEVSGTAVPEGAGPPARLDARLADLLPAPEEFPAQYPAVVLSPKAVEQAAADLTGIPPGAKVQPAQCQPPQQEPGVAETAIVVGTDEKSRTTITVALSRTDQPLAQYGEQLQRCPDVEVTTAQTKSTVHTELLPPPVVNADDALAVRQTVRSGSGAVTLAQSMLTLLAQRDDVRISATYMSFNGTEPDTAALDAIFTDAVARVAHA